MTHMDIPAGIGGTLHLGDRSTLHRIHLSNTALIPGGSRVAVQQCDLERCDLRFLSWDMFTMCRMTDCSLPSDAPQQAAQGAPGESVIFEKQGIVRWSESATQDKAARSLLMPQ